MHFILRGAMAGSGQKGDGASDSPVIADTDSRPWPVRPAPLPDESMTSWFVRLAESNGVTVNTAFNSLNPGARSAFDPDQRPPEGFVEELEKRSLVSKASLNALTLVPSLAVLQQFKTQNGSNQMPWKCKDTSVHRLIKNQVCPLCLAADPIPHFRLVWRLSFVTMCDRHRVPLWDCCPFCDGPLDLLAEFKEVPKGIGSSTTFCRTCGIDLRGAKPNRISPGESATYDLVKSALQHQRTLLAVMKAGHFSMAKGKDIEASKLFAAFRQLIKILVGPRYSQAFSQVLQTEWPTATSLPVLFRQGRDEFDQMSTIARLVIMGITDWDAHGMHFDFLQTKGSLGQIPLTTSRYWKLRMEPDFSTDPKPYTLIELNDP